MLRPSYPLTSFVSRACLVLSAFAPIASAQNVFVGPASDPDCDYTTIQAAVDAWAASPSTDFVTVFIANAQTYPATAITIPTPAASTALSLRGDMPACRLENSSGRAVLDGTGNGGLPVIAVEGFVAGDEHRYQLTLGPLEITGGQVFGNGGGVRVRGNAVVSLFEADVHDNSATNGGGIAFEATADGVPNLILFGNVAPANVHDNQATQDGGGLYCVDATMNADHYVLIAGNYSGRNGGGIAQQDCTSQIYPPRSTGVVDPDVGLRTNTAVGDGGGAWASGGYLTVNGAPPQKPAPVVGNVAGGNGGGLYFTGLGSTTSNIQRGIQFDDNHAGGDGGALFADSGYLQLSGGLSAAACSDLAGCPRFRGNHADAAGGAIALSGTANASIATQMFSDNDAAQASVMQIGGAGASATLFNVHVAGNHGSPELLRASGGSFNLQYVTIADNGADDDSLVRLVAPGGFGAQNSILYDFNGAASGVVIDAPAGTPLFIDCVLVHDVSGLAGEPNVTNLIAVDPQWDTSGAYSPGLYVPGPDSPAVDACGAGPGNIADLLGNPRPSDLPKPDGVGSYDMGAIERVPDELFGDGFEQP